MRNYLPAAAVLLLVPLQPGGQATIAPAVSGSPNGPSRYTAEFRSTVVRTLPDGGSVTTESTEIVVVDSKGRQMHSATALGKESKTEVSVADPLNHTLNYWAVPGTTAQIIDAPDVGVDTDCARKMKAINVLHPAGLQNLPIDDLGTKVILGIPARGGRVSYTLGSLQRTNELWTAIDPALGGMGVLTISMTGQSQRFTRELIRIRQGEPDPNLFVMPSGRQITRKKGMEYYCGSR